MSTLRDQNDSAQIRLLVADVQEVIGADALRDSLVPIRKAAFGSSAVLLFDLHAEATVLIVVVVVDL